MVRSALLASAFALAEAGTLKVTYGDCGAKHATVTDLQPLSISTGKTETLTGTGTSDEEVTSAHISATIKALGATIANCDGDATSDIVCNLPMGVGKITVKALSFPLAQGTVKIPVEVKTSSLIPASLANVDVHIEATEQNGESVVCLDVHTAKALEASTHPSFEQWATQFGFNGEDDNLRGKYNSNLAEIDRLNAADNGATFAVNQFSGMTFEEFTAMYLTNTEPEAHRIDSTKVPVTYLKEEPMETLAASIDWVSKGGVTPVKDQGGCGSCWAFSTMASVESMHRIGSGQIANLAEQQLVDCNTGNSGCSGGSATSAIQWLVSNPPYTTASYPYRATNGNCQSGSASGVTVGGVNLVGTSESALQSAMGGSPASVSVYADSGWQHYSSGVLDAAVTCGHNHAVLAVGYTSDAWKIKNSWGSSWGESGYIRIAKGKGGCGASGIVTSSPRIPTGVSSVVEV